MELCTGPQKSCTSKSWIFHEATVRVTFRGKRILNDLGQGFPSELFLSISFDNCIPKVIQLQVWLSRKPYMSSLWYQLTL
jgi:hypothetical protein